MEPTKKEKEFVNGVLMFFAVIGLIAVSLFMTIILSIIYL